MVSILATAYITVLLAELLGDKSIYTISSLATRFRLTYIFIGCTAAFAAKMAVATLAGQAISRLPSALVAAVSSITFFATAIVLWRKRRVVSDDAEVVEGGWRRPASVSFAAIFLTEWADAGQITAAAMTARFGHPLLVWSAATAAMMTKCLLALALGTGLRRGIPRDGLRYVALTACLVMGVFSALRIN
jgi:putative Ca2+/H+ antiporter (TMEM165/GDT1 family)